MFCGSCAVAAEGTAVTIMKPMGMFHWKKLNDSNFSMSQNNVRENHLRNTNSHYSVRAVSVALAGKPNSHREDRHSKENACWDGDRSVEIGVCGVAQEEVEEFHLDRCYEDQG